MHLAQLNVGKLKYALGAPELKEFVNFLAPINKLAEESPGFVWRLADDKRDGALEVETPFEDPELFMNFSVWENIEVLKDFSYKTVHRYFVKSRSKWFHKPNGPYMVLWWIPEGHIPSLQEAKSKLELLVAKGPSAEAFTFAHPYPEPE